MLPPAVTVTWTAPAAVAAGAGAVIEVSLLMVKLAALTLPNFTAVALMKPVPVIATEVAPPAGPLVGLTAVTVGPELAGVQVKVKRTEELECALVPSLLELPPEVKVKFERE